MMDLISIALATYNGEKYLREQLDSILNQTYQNFEVIIHDDCSVDNTVKILNEYAHKDNRIVVKKNNKNLGFAKNFESIISECKGEYIAFCDQDDVWMPNHLELLHQLIGKKDASCANALLVDAEGVSLGLTMQDVTGMSADVPEENLKFRLFYDNFAQGTAMMVRNDLCIKYLPVPPEIKYHDYWLALVAALNRGIVYSDKVILHYRQHENNVTSNIKNTLWRDIYNSINGFNRKHSAIQVKILTFLKDCFPDDIDIIDALKFYQSHAKKDNRTFVKKYYEKHQYAIFPLEKHRKLKEILYL